MWHAVCIYDRRMTRIEATQMSNDLNTPQDVLEGIVQDLENAYSFEVASYFSHFQTQTEPSDDDEASVMVHMQADDSKAWKLTISRVKY
jgi:hypothetical protein